jgi:thiamine-phosphate pyrophosphorylase
MLLSNQDNLKDFTHIGTSVHSVREAIQAQKAGATVLTAGHIFETDCKKGLPGRGLDFLKNVSEAVTIPVYGIGGVTPDNLPALVEAGAAGGCMMSLSMHIGY